MASASSISKPICGEDCASSYSDLEAEPRAGNANERGFAIASQEQGVVRRREHDRNIARDIDRSTGEGTERHRRGARRRGEARLHHEAAAHLTADPRVQRAARDLCAIACEDERGGLTDV